MLTVANTNVGNIISSIEVEEWKFNDGIERRHEKAQDAITNLKRLKYDINKTTKSLAIENEKLKQLENKAQIDQDSLWKLLVEQQKNTILILESNKTENEAKVQGLEQTVNECLQTIQSYNEYAAKAAEYLERNRNNDKLIGLSLPYLINRDKMENRIMNMYESIMRDYDHYTATENNPFYAFLPFLRPSSVTKSQEVLANKIKKQVDNIAYHLAMFPETKSEVKKYIGVQKFYEKLQKSFTSVREKEGEFTESALCVLYKHFVTFEIEDAGEDHQQLLEFRKLHENPQLRLRNNKKEKSCFFGL